MYLHVADECSRKKHIWGGKRMYGGKQNVFGERNVLQPVPKKKRLEMVIGMQTEILGGPPRSLFEGLI